MYSLSWSTFPMHFLIRWEQILDTSMISCKGTERYDSPFSISRHVIALSHPLVFLKSLFNHAPDWLEPRSQLGTSPIYKMARFSHSRTYHWSWFLTACSKCGRTLWPISSLLSTWSSRWISSLIHIAVYTAMGCYFILIVGIRNRSWCIVSVCIVGRSLHGYNWWNVECCC